MPLTTQEKKAYPPDWRARRQRILERDAHHCANCGVPNYAVGYRDDQGRFVPLRGNGPCDAAGRGRCWPDSHHRITYREAKEFLDICNRDRPNSPRYIVIVLTIAHLKRTTGEPTDGPLDCSDEDLAALCQRCHLAIDRPRHKKRRGRANAETATGSLFTGNSQ